MGPIRRTISLVLASALTVAGLGLVYLLFGTSYFPIRRIWIFGGAGLMVGLGVVWLWEDLARQKPTPGE